MINDPQDRVGTALAFMKRASRDTFKVCADAAESMAVQVESGALPMDAVTALRLLASMFRSSGERP